MRSRDVLALALPTARATFRNESTRIKIETTVMWTWISCYLTGHDYGVACEQGVIYLRCSTCGRRSHGWDVRTGSADDHAHQPATR